MKDILPIITALLLLASTTATAQSVNHVPNGSFEYYSFCPAITGQLNSRCLSWRSYTPASPDYLHSCNSNIVPQNYIGYQYPDHGDAYAGIYVYSDGPDYREYIANEITPLVIGTTYEVSMSVSLADYSRYSVKGLAVHFYDSGAYSNPIPYAMHLTPKTNFDSYGQISDTGNWIRLKTYLTADSAYDNIIIGNFYSSPSISVIDSTRDVAVMYIDSVVVKIADTFATEYSGDGICAGDTVEVSYVLLDSTGYNANTSFLLQLSNNGGAFNNPINIGSKSGTGSNIIYGSIPLNIPSGSNYKLRVVSVSPNDTAVVTKGFNITNLDSANIQVSSNSPICSGDTINFNVSHNTSYITYSWTGPNSFSSTVQNPSISNTTIANTGVYYSLIERFGCIQYDTLNIVVNQSPDVPIINSNSTLCAGDTLQLAASSTTGSSFSWTGPNNYSSNTQNPKITYATVANSGTYTVSANLNGCVRSSSTNVTVLAAPENTVANSNTPLCVGETLNLTATNNTSGVSYSWTGPNSYSSNSQNPSITNATTTQSGAYIATYSLNGCVEKDTINVAVNIVPATPVVNYNTPLCVGETLNLTGTSTTSGVSYSWTGPNSFSSNSQNPTKNSVSVSDTGTYTLTTTRLNCSSSPASIKVDIRPTPFVVMYTNDDSICKDETVTFNSLANNASGNVQYQWYVNAQAVSGATQTTYTTSQLNDGDVVYCNMIDNASCSVPFTDESNDIQITVLPWLAPSVSISVSPQGPIHQDSLMTFTATAVDAGVPIYQWKRNGQDVQGATGQAWAARTLNNNDVICVEIESGYRCPMPLTASSNCITAEVVNVNKLSNVKSLKLYPNPNAGQFVLEGRISSAAHYDIQIVNALGQVVYTADVATRAGSIYKSMDVNLASGVYLLQLQETETKQTQTVRLIIK